MVVRSYLRVLLIVLMAGLAVLSGCAPSAGPNERAGTAVGAGVGAAIGAQFGDGDTRLLAMAIGALAGSQLGGYIGRNLDERDRERMEKTTQDALETAPAGETRTWRNPDSGHEGTVTPQDRFSTAEGRVCREFQQTVTAQGETATAYGTACKQPDGTWKVVSG